MKSAAAMLALLGIAATAAAQALPSVQHAQDTVDAARVLGPMGVAFVMMMGFYADSRWRERKCADSIAGLKKESDEKIAALTSRVEGLHSQMFDASEKDSATLLMHAREMGKIVSDNTAATERVTEALDRLAERIP